MGSRAKIFFLALMLFTYYMRSQLKFLVEDFEGFASGASDLHKNGVFGYGSITPAVIKDESNAPSNPFYIEKRYLEINKTSKQNFGGWGKGISLSAELDADKDHLNFYFRNLSDQDLYFKITIQEDDDYSNTFEKDNDDAWIYQTSYKPNPEAWELISIPLNEFKDENSGGDGIFNCNYREGKLLSFIINFGEAVPASVRTLFDFICFSEGKLKEPVNSPDAGTCALGLWSEEGNRADFNGIAKTFEKLFGSVKRPAVIHLFQPFPSEGNYNENTSVNAIETIIQKGYIPMITLEDHFADMTPGKSPPNLYSIVEGHFDFFFIQWARHIKTFNSVVLVRILHEFNGDWYPWCTIKNDHNPEMVVKAYRHIRDIFKKMEVDNAKFIWCPNSMSVPQEHWNYIIKAYPGDEYVDLVGLDVYNGSGTRSGIWRSFRKEAIENYFLATKYFPGKPLIICETASRERNNGETGDRQTKEEWIGQLNTALQNDLSQIKLLCWFNEKETFKLNSSPKALQSFSEYIINNDHYSSGTTQLLKLLKD